VYSQWRQLGNDAHAVAMERKQKVEALLETQAGEFSWIDGYKRQMLQITLKGV
jgi:hypothetical protein